MKNVERALEIIENGEYSKVETYVTPIGSTHFNITTNNGGIIRLIHGNKVWFTKEYVEIILFTPHKDDAIFCGRCKSNDTLFDRVYNAWKKIVDEYYEKENDEYSKFF